VTGPGFATMTIEEFLGRLASDDPTPGGGSASAIAAAMAASLLAMVAGLSLGRPKYAAYADTIARASAVGDGARARLLALADEDAAAYDGFGAAMKMARETADEIAARQAAIGSAAKAATLVPLAVIRECAEIAAELESLAGRSNLNAASDLAVASLLADAAARGAAANVFINLPSVGDSDFEGRTMIDTTDALAVIEDLAAEVRQHVGRGKLRDPERA
jgi:formiminotetrahydrofolate cyclodeaminase